MSDSGKIAPTAHYTAYTWHRLGLPHAELFTTELGRRLFHAYRLLDLPSTLRGRPSTLRRTLENRHRLIDGEIARRKPDLVVELGAGLSRRGVTFAVDHGVNYLEVDLPEMVRYKARLIEERAPARVKQGLRGKLRTLAADFTADDFAHLLARELVHAENPLVIAEGVVGYFERPLQRKLLASVCHGLAGRGAMLADLRVKRTAHDPATRVLRFGILIATRGRGAADSFRSVAEVEGLFAEAGFGSVEKLPSPPHEVLSHVWCARP